MLEKLRTRDAELFAQLGVICDHLTRSSRMLEQMLAGLSGEEGRLADAIHASDREAHDVAREVDVRVFKAFVMRVDRMELHTFVAALDATVDVVDKAALHTAALHGGGAPQALRDLAGLLTRAADALADAVDHVPDARREVERRAVEVRQAADAGRRTFEVGFSALFAGTSDVVDVLRWKDIYEKIRDALERCAEATDALQQMTHHTT